MSKKICEVGFINIPDVAVLDEHEFETKLCGPCSPFEMIPFRAADGKPINNSRSKIVSVSFIDDELTEIPDRFMCNCINFNSYMGIPDGVQKIGSYFMENCRSFNNIIDFPKSLETIGDGFLMDVSKHMAFDTNLHIPDGVTRIGSYFLYGCTKFNSPITFPASLEKIGRCFMNGMEKFNHPIDIHSVTDIGDCFLCFADEFNSDIILSDDITRIPNAFLEHAPKFHPVHIDIPDGVEEIGYAFMAYSCKDAFGEKIVAIPASVRRIGTYLLEANPSKLINHCTLVHLVDDDDRGPRLIDGK